LKIMLEILNKAASQLSWGSLQTTTLCVIITVAVVWRLCRRDNDHIYRHVHKHSAMVESVDDEFTVGLPTPRIAVKMSQLAFAKYGFMVQGSANRRIISDFMREEMLKHGMRPSHIMAQLPVAVELYFAPTPGQVEAVRYAKVVRDERRRTGLGLAPQ